MSAQILDGKILAAQLREQVAAKVSALRASGKRAPGLAVVLVGGDPASQVYVGMKEKMTEAVGMHSVAHRLPETTSEQELLAVVAALNADPAVDGILVQLPLPAGIDSTRVIEAIAPDKDVDGFHPVNVGKLMLGDSDGFLPCTPAGVHQLLIRSGVRIEGAEVVILGRGNIVGKPMAAILLQKAKHANATVTLCHSLTPDIPVHTRRADILVAALGSARYVTAEMIKPGAVIVDVGVNRIPGPTARGGSRLVGDVDFEGVQPRAGLITPNPGGVGPMTIAMLMANTLQAMKQAM